MIALWLFLAGGGAALLLLTWVLYPALIRRRAARIRPSPGAVSGAPPTVSVILVTKEGPERLRERVDDILRTTHPLDRLEIIVAFDSVPPANDIDGALPRSARVIVTAADPPGGKACGLNSAVRTAEAEVLVFADTHQRFDPEAIPLLVRALQRGPWAVVSGALHVTGADRTSNLLTAYWERERTLREAEARVHSSVGVTGAIYAMWRNRWTPLPAGLILDDLYVPMRRVLAGDRVGFEALAIAVDTRSTQPNEEFRRKVRTMTGNLQLCAWLPEVLYPRKNPIWVQFLCHKLLRLLTPYCLAGILVGTLGLVVLLQPSTIPILLTIAAVFLTAMLLSPDPLSQRVRAAARWGLTMQAAAVLATINGLRGNWDVWHRSSKPAGRG